MRVVSALSLALLLSMTAPPAHAAAKQCQDGAKASVDGIVFKFINHDTRSWLFIDTPAWDCGPVYIETGGKQAAKCPLGYAIHATGTLLKPDPGMMYADGWRLSDSTAGNGDKTDESFSCTYAPPSPRPQNDRNNKMN